MKNLVGDEFVELGKGNISIQCQEALKFLLQRERERDKNYTDVMSE